MYDFLSKYLMTEEDLVENGYPRPCPTAPGKAVFKTKKPEQSSRDRKIFANKFLYLKMQSGYNLADFSAGVCRFSFLFLFFFFLFFL